jgi:MFS family permease
MPRAYRSVLDSRGVTRLVVAAVTSRVPTSMLGLSLLLTVVDRYGSYAAAGTVLTVHALALALCAPVAGRLADVWGPRRTLLRYLVAHAGAFGAVLAAILLHVDSVVLGLAAVAVGATTPPAGPVTRAQWPKLVDGERLGSAYALDSALNSATFIAGPLLVAGLAALGSPLTAVALAGASKVIGDALLATAPSLDRTDTGVEAAATRRPLGPLADAGVRRLLGVVSLDTFMHGCIQVGAAAVAAGGGLTGFLVSAVSAGEVAGGLAYGLRAWPGGPRLQLAGLHAVAAVLLGLAGFTGGAPALGALFVAIGLASGGRDTLTQLVLGAATPAPYRTEVFAWLSTFMWAGYGAGTAIAGQIAARGGATPVFLAAAASGLIAAAVVVRLRTGAAAGYRLDLPGG